MSIGDVWAQIAPELVGLVGTALILLVVFARSKLNELIKENIDNKAVATGLAWLNDVTLTVVEKASQTTKRQLQAALADGKITEEERKQLLEKLKTEVVDEVLGLTWGRIQTQLGITSRDEAKKLVEAKVESAVKASKASEPLVPLSAA